MAGDIHRQKKNRDFVTIDTHCLRNKNLKWDAKGLHSYLMQLPDDWKINVADLEKRSLDRHDGTMSPMRALIAAGYVYRERISGEKGRFVGYDYHLFERPEQTIEWLTVNGKSIDGKTVNGKTATSKVLRVNKNEESVETERFAPHAPAENKHSTVEEKIPLSPKVAPKGSAPAAPFTAPRRVDTVDEAEEIIMEWASADGRESVRKWYSEAFRACTESDVKAMVAKFAGVYLTIGDEGKRQRMAQDPLQFFKYTFKSFLKTEKSFSAKVMPGASAAQQTPPANFQTSTRY